jgi:hypothetical protein
MPQALGLIPASAFISQAFVALKHSDRVVTAREFNAGVVTRHERACGRPNFDAGMLHLLDHGHPLEPGFGGIPKRTNAYNQGFFSFLRHWKTLREFSPYTFLSHAQFAVGVFSI